MMRDISLEAKLEKLVPDLPRWPLTPFGTMVLLGIIVGLAIGVYECYECYDIRGLR